MKKLKIALTSAFVMGLMAVGFADGIAAAFQPPCSQINPEDCDDTIAICCFQAGGGVELGQLPTL